MRCFDCPKSHFIYRKDKPNRVMLRCYGDEKLYCQEIIIDKNEMGIDRGKYCPRPLEKEKKRVIKKKQLPTVINSCRECPYKFIHQYSSEEGLKIGWICSYVDKEDKLHPIDDLNNILDSCLLGDVK